MAEQTDSTSVSALKSILAMILKGLAALVAITVVIAILALVIGIPVLITVFVVVNAFQMGGYLYAVPAQIIMGLFWTLIIG